MRSGLVFAMSKVTMELETGYLSKGSDGPGEDIFLSTTWNTLGSAGSHQANQGTEADRGLII